MFWSVKLIYNSLIPKRRIFFFPSQSLRTYTSKIEAEEKSGFRLNTGMSFYYFVQQLEKLRVMGVWSQYHHVVKTSRDSSLDLPERQTSHVVHRQRTSFCPGYVVWFILIFQPEDKHNEGNGFCATTFAAEDKNVTDVLTQRVTWVTWFSSVHDCMYMYKYSVQYTGKTFGTLLIEPYLLDSTQEEIISFPAFLARRHLYPTFTWVCVSYKAEQDASWEGFFALYLLSLLLLLFYFAPFSCKL